MIGTIIGILVLALLVGGGIFLWIYFQTDILSRHEVTMVIGKTWVDPSKEGGSHYMVTAQDNGKIIEILRTSYGWDKNEDRVFAVAQENVGKEVTFSCWGVPFEALYWYDNCDSIVAVAK